MIGATDGNSNSMQPNAKSLHSHERVFIESHTINTSIKSEHEFNEFFIRYVQIYNENTKGLS